MNFKWKLIVSRICLSCFCILVLLFPWNDIGISIPSFIINGKIVVDSKYIFSGVLFVISFLLWMIEEADSKRMRCTKEIQLFRGVANRIMIEGVLISLAYYGFINVIAPVLLFVVHTFKDATNLVEEPKRDTFFDKMTTIFLFLGTALLLFYNLPFEMWGIYVAEIIIYIATLLSLISLVIHKIPWNKTVASQS